MYAFFRKFLLAAVLILALCVSVFAADAETMYHSEYCFSEADFCVSDMGSVDGIFITAVPDAAVAVVRLGNRTIRAGDVLSAYSLDQLKLIPACSETCNAVITYCPIYGNYLAEPAELTIRIQSGKNEAPKASNVEFETYKNVANDGKLSAADPEEGQLTYQLVDAPKRGSVKFEDDGTFIYTPEKNKVGEDRFTYTVTDEAGNVSKPATVNIKILNPTEKMTFADMEENLNCFEAMWLQEQGLCSGRTIGTQYCFGPQETVSRGEFLVMAMELLGVPIEQDAASVTFADSSDAPLWMQPYLTSALRHGMIRGQSSEAGLCFYPNEAITGQEAAVMLQNILELPVPAATLQTAQPAWAIRSVLALSDAGICADYSETAMTRIEVAILLYQISDL